MNLPMSIGHTATTREHANSTMFLPSVSQLVSVTASPKHPQSLMGLAMTSQSVSGVIMHMTATISLDTTLRHTAKSRNTPRQNSTAERSTDEARTANSGTY